MGLKKSQLYSSLWQSCDELRGGMDASQYKDYVLTLLFMKYVSDKYADKPNALIEVPKGGGFTDMVGLKGDKEIGDKINKIIGRLAEANDLKGVIDQADFNDDSKLGSGKEMQDRLSKLVAIFDGLDFRANRAEGDDLLGDAYEYLMRHFATESGKSKGQFYTPAEVSRIMAQVVGIGADTRQDQTIYDPTCGSGSLLRRNVIEKNPARGIKVPKQDRTDDPWTYLSRAEIDQLLSSDALTGDQRWAFGLAIFTGLRKGELKALRWEDVILDGPRPEVVVRFSNDGASKSGRVGRTPLLPMAVEIFEEMIEARHEGEKPTGLVWPSRDGKLRNKAFDWGWRDKGAREGAKTKAGITRPVRFHDLRHTAAAALVSGAWGEPWRLEEVKEFLRHRDIKTTQRYAHLCPDALHAKAARMTASMTTTKAATAAARDPEPFPKTTNPPEKPRDSVVTPARFELALPA